MPSDRERALLRLVAQRLVGPPLATAAEAVTWMTGMQAQDRPGVVTSVALRTAQRSTDEVHAAFEAGQVVVSWPLRGTLHLVPAEDLRWMLALSGGQARARSAGRHRQLGIDASAVDRCRELAAPALAEAGRLRREDLLAVWRCAGVEVSGQRGYHLLLALALDGAVCFGPFDGSEHLLVAVDTWVPRPRALDREEALGELALRWFRSHGPAGARDLARWSGLPMADVREAVALARPHLEVLQVDGDEHLMDPQTPERLAALGPAARRELRLPGFDELVVGYPVRGNPVIPEELAGQVVPGGNGMFRPSVVRDGRVVATWSPSARRGRRGGEPGGG